MTGLARDCFAVPGGRISVADALRLLRERAGTVVASETVPLDLALGRCLAAPIRAPRDVPAFDNAAVDGYAFAFRPELAGGASLTLAEGRAAAGHPLTSCVPSGACVRVLTGAPRPVGTDTVALQESTGIVGVEVRIPGGLRAGANRRRAGEDVVAGSLVLDRGDRLGPAEIGVVAELGLASIEVYRPLRVALLSSGDELIEPGCPMRAGGVYDANRHMLRGLLRNLPVAVVDLGILPDDANAVRERLSGAAMAHDVVLTSGGASRGDEDHVVRSVQAQGQIHFWQIAMKPGRPLAFGQLDKAVFVGLPGNPVAAMVCFLLFARPLLLRLGGGRWPEPRRFPVRAGFSMTKQAGRTELVRARLEGDDADGWLARKVPRQGSGVLTTMLEADGLVELVHDRTSVGEGDSVPFLSFAELLAV
jgi:molybdopterin molybdotransferase